MPYHLELGSEGHSFHGKAIVVNSQTGEHKTKHPLPIDLAKAQMKALENREAPPAPKAKKELHEDYKGPRNKDGTPKKSTKAWGMYVRERDRPKPEMMKMKHEAQKEDIPEREGEGPKQVKAKEVKKEEPKMKRTEIPIAVVRAAISKNTRDDYLIYEYFISDLFYSDWNKKAKLTATKLEDMFPGKGITKQKDNNTIMPLKFFYARFREYAPAEAQKEEPKKEEPKKEAKSDALAEFIGSAPEDITGVDYGAKNKEGKLQQGVLTKMLGRENLEVAKSIIISCQGAGSKKISYSRLCGAIRFIRNIALGIENDSSDVKANTYEVYSVEVGEGGSKDAKDADMCMRILANHEKGILAPYTRDMPGDDPKDRSKPLRVYMTLPTSRTLRLIESQMPQGFNSNVGHTSGMGHARDNYKWQIDTHDLNLKTKAGRDKRDDRKAECSKVAKGLLESLLANLKEGAYLYLDKAHTATDESKATEKAKAKAAFEIPQGEKNAVEVFLTEDILRSIILAITGDPKKASAKVEEYRTAGKLGRKARVYQSNRGNKNTIIDFVKE
jgi:hypothetical protein